MRKDLSKHNEKLGENNLRKSRAELVKNCKEIAAKQGIPTKQQIKEAFSHPWEQGSPYPFRVGEELRPIENNLMFCETSPYVLLLW